MSDFRLTSMKILVVMGTRPETIKLAPVVAALRRRKLRTLVCATGQHRELLDQALKVFGLKPDFDLDLMRPRQSPAAVARRVMASLLPLLDRIRPGLVIVQGDTTTAMAAALSARLRAIPVAHVEAGLRSFDPADPFPEENNRVIIDHLSTLHFPPTQTARANLAREGLRGRNVVVTGNTVVDALRWTLRRDSNTTPPPPGAVEVADCSRLQSALVTFHRRESFGKPLQRVFRALSSLVERHQRLILIYPVHPNPSVQSSARRLLRHPRIRLVEPLPYLELLRLMRQVDFVITDSGGLQEEAVCLHKPVLVAREKTERPEILEAGAGLLVGLKPRRLARWASRLLEDPALCRRMSRARNPYGDGRAAERVAAAVARWIRPS